MELLIGKPITNSVTWYAYLKMSKLGDIPHYDGVGHIMYKSKLKLNRPVYVGMCILDLSKLLMYDFYYNELKAQYGELHRHRQLTPSHRDGRCSLYKDMAQHSDLYGTSDYPKDHYLHSLNNIKVLGEMKDECAGKPIVEYVGLRPKMYSILKSDGNIRKAKGVGSM